MKRFGWLIAITFALSTFFSAQALAQNVQGHTGMVGTQAVPNFYKADDVIGKNVVGTNGTAAGQMGTSETEGDTRTGMMEGQSFESSSRLSALLGKPIVTQDGSKAGELQSVIFAQNGDAQFAIIESGGFLGLGKKNVAVPWNLVKVLPDQNLMVNVAVDKLKNAPSYSDESFSPEWENKVHAYYGAPAKTEPGAQTPRAMGGAAGFKANDLMDKNVVSEQGFTIGKIQDAVLSKDGKIDYLFISREGGARGKFVVVPWQAAKLEPQRDQVTLMINKDKLDNAPVVSDSDWQKINDPEWTRQLRNYYGVGSGTEMQKPGMQEPMTERAPMGESSEGTSGTY